MGSTKSAKELALEQIILSATLLFREKATSLIKEDENMKKIWIAVQEKIQEDFPKYVHDAMTHYLASHLNSMQGGLQQALMQSNASAFSIEDIKRRIGIQQ